MKKIMVILGLFFPSMCLAQTSFIPKFHEGMIKTCKSEIVSSGQNELGVQKVKIVFDSRYFVKNTSKDSVIIEATVTSLDIQNADTLVEQVTDFDDMKAILNKPILFSFNLDGTMRRLLNKSEVKESMKEYVKTLPIGISVDDFANMMVTDNSMLNLIDKAGLFSYYGKALNTNDFDMEEVNGIKVKRVFTISPDGKEFSITYSPGMTSDELKNTLIDQMRMGGRNDMADQLEQQWPMLEVLGYNKIEVNGTANVCFDENGFMSSKQSHVIINAMGTKTEISTKSSIQ